MNRTVKITLASVAALVLIAGIVAVKLIWFPSVNDLWFQVNTQKLRQVPIGKVIVRPTHFAGSSQKGTLLLPKRWVGRNVTFKEMIGAAYSENPGYVWLPPDAPKNNFDFLVTAGSNPSGLLREAIQKKTGYTASKEMHDANVLALKIVDPSLPGFKASPAGEKQNGNVKDGRLYFTHTKLNTIVSGLGNFLKMPVVDKTDLTNFYDFSLPWKAGTNPNQLTREDFDKIFGDWGLVLEDDTASVEMLVVKKAK